MSHPLLSADAVAGSYCLVYRYLGAKAFQCIACTTLSALAYATQKTLFFHQDCIARNSRLIEAQAFSARGCSMDIVALAAYGRNLLKLDREKRFAGPNTFTYRFDPVPGLRRSHGRRGSFRNIQTTGERRLAALVVSEDGEVGARAARNVANLPKVWDDQPFSRRGRSWKVQGKRRKSWDRGGLPR
jgi:hypothetical protein